MRILGTEPSSVILSQIKQFQKLGSNDSKVPKQAEAYNYYFIYNFYIIF